MRQMKQAHIKKPLPVKVVEALGWAYVALSVFPLVACSLFEFFWLSLSLGMVLGLRRGRRALFLSLHAIILSLVALCCVASLLHGTEPQVTWVLVLLLLLAYLLLVAPVILLCLPSSNLWFKEKLGGKAEPKGFLVCMILVLILILAALIPELICGLQISRNAKRGLSMAARGRELFLDMVMNDAAHKEGADWVDLAACTNSTQFVKALREKHKDGEGERTRDFGPYADIWCIAVNPPEDDFFPKFFTCNLDPRELLSQVDRNWTLTCPRKWGGTCFSFCERAAVVVHRGGAAHIVKSKYARWRYIFPNGIPKLGPDTYFLTPTGRVDLAVSAAGK